MQIRDERPASHAEIRHLLDQAFAGEPVGQLVDDLRLEQDLSLSLVAEEAGRVIGHIGFSPIAIAPCPICAFQLSPLAVAEAHRRQGVGAALVLAGIARCRELGGDAILVLGDPHYYSRFGFEAKTAAHLRSRWSGPHLQAIELRPDALQGCSFLALAPAFERLP